MPAPHLTLRQLQIFQCVAERGSTAAAASALALSQSATSAAIIELERALAMPLFDRIGRRLQLNEDGRALLPQAVALLDGADSLERWARDRESQVGALRLGASTTIGNYLLPGILGRFQQTLARPALPLRVHVTIANTAAITAQVAAFGLDLGLIEGPCHERELSVEPWIEDELLVVVAPSDPILPRKGRRRIALGALRRATWLLRESGSGTRETIDQLLTPHLHQLRAGIEFGNSEAIKRAAASGLGITCLSRYAVEDFLKSGQLLAPATELPRLTRRFHLVRHERKRPTRGLELFTAYLARLK